MANVKKKHVKSNNKIAQLMYSAFSLNEIYVAAAYGMGMDVRCESKTGVPQELTEKEFDKITITAHDFTRARIERFQAERNKFILAFLKKHGIHYDEYRGMTETERYAYMWLSSIWYRD